MAPFKVAIQVENLEVGATGYQLLAEPSLVMLGHISSPFAQLLPQIYHGIEQRWREQVELGRFGLKFQLHLSTLSQDCVWSQATEQLASDGSSNGVTHLTQPEVQREAGQGPHCGSGIPAPFSLLPCILVLLLWDKNETPMISMGGSSFSEKATMMVRKISQITQCISRVPGETLLSVLARSFPTCILKQRSHRGRLPTSSPGSCLLANT